MSFSSETKNEMAMAAPDKECCMLAEISGFLRTCGKVRLEGLGKMSYVLTTENAAAARRIIVLMKDYFGIKLELSIGKSTVLKKNNVYEMTLSSDDNCKGILREAGILKIREGFDVFNYGIDESLIHKKCCKKAFLRGAFLGSGSITDPGKSYHLEIASTNELLSANLIRLMEQLGIPARETQRREYYLVYLKDSELIGDFLAATGAYNARLDLENIKMTKELRNRANRIVNCDSANLDKTIAASEKHVRAIEKIIAKRGLDSLPEKLAEIAQLRIEEPGLSLADLGKMMDPPLGKSGVNHRLNKILEIAEKL